MQLAMATDIVNKRIFNEKMELPPNLSKLNYDQSKAALKKWAIECLKKDPSLFDDLVIKNSEGISPQKLRVIVNENRDLFKDTLLIVPKKPSEIK